MYRWKKRMVKEFITVLSIVITLTSIIALTLTLTNKQEYGGLQNGIVLIVIIVMLSEAIILIFKLFTRKRTDIDKLNELNKI